MLHRDVAPGVHRVADAYVNYYLLEDGGSVTIVDAGLPTSWKSVQSALAEIGSSPANVEAIVLTHAHFDHVGFAERARREWHVPVWVHERDGSLSRHPLHYEHEHTKLRHLTDPKGLLILATMVVNGMPLTKGVSEVRAFSAEVVLDVPGRPRAIHVPGHTWGSVALHLPDRGVLIAGDAIVTMDPYSGRTGARIVSGAATADSREAMASLQALLDTGAETVLVGHGDPWTAGIEQVVAQARANGPG